jgi:hypothetical protein
MAFTQAQITALEKAIATGATRVRYGDRDVQYRDLEEMERLLAKMKLSLAGTTKMRQVRVNAVKGFGG